MLGYLLLRPGMGEGQGVRGDGLKGEKVTAFKGKIDEMVLLTSTELTRKGDRWRKRERGMVLNEGMSSRTPWPPPLGVSSLRVECLLLPIVLRPFEPIPERTDRVSRAF
ncbi:hypothetical protein SRHO_G00129830 [Serrasalmus rhombeus]